MGLDGATIVMEVEDHFGILFRESEMVTVRTVGDLVALIHDRLLAAHQNRCYLLTAYRSLQTVVRDVTGNDSLRICPREKVSDILVPSQRRKLWSALADLLEAPPRPLRRPLPLRFSLGGVTIVLVVFGVAMTLLIDVQIWPLTLAVAALAICGLHLLTIPFCSEPPKAWVTFGDIAKMIASTSVATKQLHLRTAEDVLNELRPLLVDVLGVDPDEVVATARFIEDLGMD